MFIPQITQKSRTKLNRVILYTVPFRSMRKSGVFAGHVVKKNIPQTTSATQLNPTTAPTIAPTPTPTSSTSSTSSTTSSTPQPQSTWKQSSNFFGFLDRVSGATEKVLNSRKPGVPICQKTEEAKIQQIMGDEVISHLIYDEIQYLHAPFWNSADQRVNYHYMFFSKTHEDSEYVYGVALIFTRHESSRIGGKDIENPIISEIKNLKGDLAQQRGKSPEHICLKKSEITNLVPKDLCDDIRKNACAHLYVGLRGIELPLKDLLDPKQLNASFQDLLDKTSHNPMEVFKGENIKYPSWSNKYGGNNGGEGTNI